MRDWKRAIFAAYLLFLPGAGAAQSVTPAYLVPGVQRTLGELFPVTNEKLLPGDLEVVGWTAGFYWYDAPGNFNPALRVLGDDPLICGGCLAHAGRPIWGYTFRNRAMGTVVGQADWDAGSVMIDADFAGASVSVDVVILQRCVRPVGSVAYGCTNMHVGPMIFPTRGPVLLNPMAEALASNGYAVNPQTILNSTMANALSADAKSAVVVAQVTNVGDPSPVTFSVIPSGIATLTEFVGDYLKTPAPGGGSTLTVPNPSPFNPSPSGWCDTTKCVSLALLWAPPNLPLGIGNPPVVNLAVQTAQGGVPLGTATLFLQPPPVLLIHGLWSSAAEAKFVPGSGGLLDYLKKEYGHPLIDYVDYKSWNDQSFAESRTQDALAIAIKNVMMQASYSGTVARQVDIVAHSMGGLVSRRFMSKPPPLALESLPANPVRKLVTIGTPHNGSPLADELAVKRDVPVAGFICATLPTGTPCTLGEAFALKGMNVDTAIFSLRPLGASLAALSPSPYSAIIGMAPVAGISPESNTERFLTILTKGFLGKRLSEILVDTHDTIVPTSSQLGGHSTSTVIVPNVVHSVKGDPAELGETGNPIVWMGAYTSLTGQPAPLPDVRASSADLVGDPLPSFDLTGYTEVAASNVGFDPISGTPITSNAQATIGAYSISKTISQLWLFQTVADPTDTPVLAKETPPYLVAFTPHRLGSADFVAIAVFSDMTYAKASLSYPLQATGSTSTLGLINPPIGNMASGITFRIPVSAKYTNGTFDVTAFATYRARSGGATVFSASAGGEITTTGIGTDWLDVSYAGLTVSTPITVAILGACSNFADIDPASAFCSNIAWIRNRNVTLGCAGNIYCQSDQVSRVQMAAFMNRLATALIDSSIVQEESLGTITVGSGAVVCQTDDVTINAFPRIASVKAVFMGLAALPVRFEAVPVASFDGGSTWVALTFTPLPSTAGPQWSNALVQGKTDLEPGQRVRFGLRMTHAGVAGTANLIDSRCLLRARIGNRNG